MLHVVLPIFVGVCVVGISKSAYHEIKARGASHSEMTSLSHKTEKGAGPYTGDYCGVSPATVLPSWSACSVVPRLGWTL